MNPVVWLWHHADMGCAAAAVFSSKQTLYHYSTNLYNAIISKQALYWHTKNSHLSCLGNVFMYHDKGTAKDARYEKPKVFMYSGF